jgi:hypothetical protein
MYDARKLTRVTVLAVVIGLSSTASCRHNDGSSPTSPSSPGTRTPDSGTTTHPNGVDDTKTGEPIGPVSGEPRGRALIAEIQKSAGVAPRGPVENSPLAARAADGLGGVGGSDGSGGMPGLGGAPGGMGGLPQPSPEPTIHR